MTSKAQLSDFFKSLNPSGPIGFEGLIAKALETLTGQAFRLAKSGSQRGRDISSNSLTGNAVAVECKRYSSTTELHLRDLKGGLTEAIESIFDLDLWVLVTSRDVPSQIDESLRRQANDKGILYFSISDSTDVSDLDVLCANAIDVVLEYSTELEDYERIKQYLEDIANSDTFSARIEDLKTKFLSPLVGYENWKINQNRKLLDCLKSAALSRAKFGQSIHVSGNAYLVRRNEAFQRLDEWIKTWPDTSSLMTVVGEEGDGKTWCAVSWLSEKIDSDPLFPPALFLSSEMVSSNEPLDLIAHSIEKQQSGFRIDAWRERVRRWVGNRSGTQPTILLVIDGVNERRDSSWWRTLLEKLNGREYESIATLVTCRQEYWRRYFEPLPTFQSQSYALPPYGEKELSEALSFYNLQLSDISDSLLPLVTKPRYFDLMVKYRARIEKSGDITAARLVYEDWKDRYARNRACPIDDMSFREIISELAEKYRDETQYLRSRDIEALLPPEKKTDILRELSSGGILRSRSTGKYSVDSNFLVYGLGLLLVEELESFGESTDEEIFNAIASWLEPHPEMDIKASICGFASLHTLSLKNFPRKVKAALLNAWLGSRNPNKSVDDDITAYLPLDPDAYLDLAEIIWSDIEENTWGQQLLMRTFLRWCNSPVVEASLQCRFEKWLGFIPIYGHPSQRRDALNLGQTNRADVLHAEIANRVGFPLKANDQVDIGNYTFTGVEDDGLLRLGRVALAIISHLPRNIFIHAVTTGLFSEKLLGYTFKGNLTSWVLRSSSNSLWPQVKEEVDCLANCGNRFAVDAAYALLDFEGSNLAMQKQQDLEASTAVPDPFFEKMRNNPCRYRMRWSKEDCEQCLLLQDLNINTLAEQLRWFAVDPEFEIPDRLSSELPIVTESINISEIMIAMGATSADHMLKTYEPGLCAYAPDSVVSIIRQVFRQAEDREGLSLRQLSVHVSEYSLLLGEEEYVSITNAWREVVNNTQAWEEPDITTECFLFKEVLFNTRDAYEQLQLSIERPEPCLDLLAYEPISLPLPDWGRLCSILESSTDPRQTQRILFFISSNSEGIPKDVLETAILPLFENTDSLVRACVLKLLYLSKYTLEIADDIIGEWHWSLDNSYQENYWGSILLGVYGTHLPFAVISNRIYPNYLGYALKGRGYDNDEIISYLQNINHWLERIRTEFSALTFDGHLVTILWDCSPSEDFPKPKVQHSANSGNEQSITFTDKYYSWGGERTEEDISLESFVDEGRHDRERKSNDQQMSDVIDRQNQTGNIWFSKRFEPSLLVRCLNLAPELSAQWIAYLSGEHAARYLQLGGSFYTSLCEAMFDLGLQDKAATLYQQLQSPTVSVHVSDVHSGINLLDYALFRAEATLHIQKIWGNKLYSAKTNADVIRLVSLLWYGSGQDWLWKVIEDELALSAPLGKTRAGIFLSCIPSVNAFERLNQLYEEVHEDSWLRQYFEKSKEFWQRDSWSKHWFSSFWSADSDKQAWTSFRLFLFCVDSRFWFWRHEIDLRTSISVEIRKRKQTFYESNISNIKNRINKNEKNLHKTYLGHKIIRGEAWPWM